MRYVVTIGGREYCVGVNGSEVQVNGNPVRANLVRVPRTPLRQLMMGEVSHTYVMLNDGESWVLGRGGRLRIATVEDERTRQLRDMTGAGRRKQAGGQVVAPMPGLVVRVEVEEGQAVEAGKGVVVLEAMKMENEISAVAGGKVKAVRVTAGQAVEKGAVLVEISDEP